eukprot:1319019-Rhodomonas_salina.1
MSPKAKLDLPFWYPQPQQDLSLVTNLLFAAIRLATSPLGASNLLFDLTSWHFEPSNCNLISWYQVERRQPRTRPASPRCSSSSPPPQPSLPPSP